MPLLRCQAQLREFRSEILPRVKTAYICTSLLFFTCTSIFQTSYRIFSDRCIGHIMDLSDKIKKTKGQRSTMCQKITTKYEYVNWAGHSEATAMSVPWLAQRVPLSWLAFSTVSDPSRSGRFDMLTGPVAAARAVVATGAWVKSKHDLYLIRGSVGA